MNSKYFVSYTTYLNGEERDNISTFSATDVENMFDQLLQEVDSNGMIMGKVFCVYKD